ncbi:hypothetical protein GGX14DRAFT_391606 [Mycena pura]|uniref:Uncharacterized protein n=1 Tax=Mycena pura TaxID=153505 RepID=A0AAD6VPR5_9AGAR|nr:hypothetical protein GGX14DRAFT_391606 [Mycena pura]
MVVSAGDGTPERVWASWIMASHIKIYYYVSSGRPVRPIEQSEIVRKRAVRVPPSRTLWQHPEEYKSCTKYCTGLQTSKDTSHLAPLSKAVTHDGDQVCGGQTTGFKGQVYKPEGRDMFGKGPAVCRKNSSPSAGSGRCRSIVLCIWRGYYGDTRSRIKLWRRGTAMTYADERCTRHGSRRSRWSRLATEFRVGYHCGRGGRASTMGAEYKCSRSRSTGVPRAGSFLCASNASSGPTATASASGTARSRFRRAASEPSRSATATTHRGLSTAMASGTPTRVSTVVAHSTGTAAPVAGGAAGFAHNVGGIVGVAIGGSVALVLGGALVYLVFARRRRAGARSQTSDAHDARDAQRRPAVPPTPPSSSSFAALLHPLGFRRASRSPRTTDTPASEGGVRAAPLTSHLPQTLAPSPLGPRSSLLNPRAHPDHAAPPPLPPPWPAATATASPTTPPARADPPLGLLRPGLTTLQQPQSFMDHIDYSRPIGGRVAVREGETPTPDSADPAPAGPEFHAL